MTLSISDNTRGAVLMMGSMAAFTLNDTFVKALAGEVPLFQLLVLRGVLTTLFSGVLAWKMGALHLRIPPRDRGLIVLRMIGEIGAAYFFLTALFNMPLANVTAILQSLPLLVTLCAALFFGEALGWRRITAILIGLCGVMLIVRPGAEGFNIYSVYALISVAFVVLRDLSTRRLSGATPSMMVTFATTFSVTLFFGAASVTVDWVPLNQTNTLLILGAAGMVMGGYVLSVMVMRVGEISFVAPFRYTGLIWALTLGWFVFGDWPRPLTLIGAAIVVGSGVFMLYRERQLAQRIRQKER
ncbi:S-adenosylmethionine uptake transporter [Thalassovita litoralis]|uniref:S-adenosylmethionine uptake transporter n=1 Tax=Thalassovita litoralis TaxID=1010611 RepID=A0A521CLC3_9RHOB|nr:DMT family transporter [Thalassovita litoralis]SMO60236.1 S-adenosylmethionine uptake transporter [Thalassovita litoralis]